MVWHPGLREGRSGDHGAKVGLSFDRLRSRHGYPGLHGGCLTNDGGYPGLHGGYLTDDDGYLKMEDERMADRGEWADDRWGCA